MTDTVKPNTPRKKTPADATPFEREQLRFLLSGRPRCDAVRSQSLTGVAARTIGDDTHQSETQS